MQPHSVYPGQTVNHARSGHVCTAMQLLVWRPSKKKEDSERHGAGQAKTQKKRRAEEDRQTKGWGLETGKDKGWGLETNKGLGARDRQGLWRQGLETRDRQGLSWGLERDQG